MSTTDEEYWKRDARKFESLWRRAKIEKTTLEKRIDELCEENEKLRKLAILQSVLFKRMSACPTTDCQICPVKEECAEFVHLEGLLGIDDKMECWRVQWRIEDATDVQAENSKLKELTTQALKIIKHVNVVMAIDWASYSTVMSMARELGIEAE